MKKRLIVFVTIVFILLGIGSVRAVDNFNLAVEQTHQETCPTVFTVYQFTVTNVGDEVDTYTVSKSGSAAAWALSSPPGFVLEPGNSQAIFVYVTPSKGAQTGTYSLDLAVTGGKAGIKQLEVVLDIDECHALEIDSQETSQEICTGESASYSFVVENKGYWSENVRLSLSGSAAQWSSLSEEFLRLENGESQIINIFTEPEVNQLGDFDLAVTARSLESNALDNKEFDLIVNGCYAVDLSANENFASFCENSEVKVPLTLKNSGTARDTYTINIEGVQWSAMDQTQVTLESGSQTTINAIIFPGYGVQGKFPITVTAKSLNGDAYDSIDLTANVMKCHEVSMSITEESDVICPITTENYVVEIMNVGTKTERFGLSLSAPSWVSLEANSIELGPAQSGKLNLIANPDANVLATKYPIDVEVKSLSASGVSARDSMNLEVSSRDSCFGVRTTAEKDSIKISYGEGTLMPIVIENIGSETESFSLDLSGNGAAFGQLNPSSVIINGNSAETVYVYIAIPEETERDTYSLIVSARDKLGVVSSSSTIYISLTDEPTIIEQPEPLVSDDSELGLFASIKAGFNRLTDSITGVFTKSDSAESTEELLEESEEETPIESEDFPEELLDEIPEELLDELEEETPEELLDELLEESEEETPEELLEETTENEKNIFSSINTESIKQSIYEHRYKVLLIFVVILVLVVLIAGKSEDKKGNKKSAWKRFTDWLEEEDENIEEIEIIDEIKPKKSLKTKKEHKGIWKRFTNWLEKEDELDILYKDSKPSKKKVEVTKPAKKKGKGAWSKFTDWLDEEEELIKPISNKKVTNTKSSKKNEKVTKPAKKKGKGAWSKFTAWLDEEEEIEKPKIKKTLAVTKPVKKSKTKSKPNKKKEKTGLDKFKKWLDEE